MTNLQKLALRLSEVRSRLNDISGLEADALTDEVKTEAEALTAEYQGLEVRHRAAIIADGNTEARPADATDQLEAEARERLELRSKARLAAYVSAALRGTLVSGAEAELMSASGITDGIPLELFDTREVIETRAERAITPAPATVGVNMDLVRPAVFAPSIAERLMIDMPRVESGAYATGTIATSLTAEAVAKSADVPQTPGAITINTTSPHRVGASLGVALEDVAGVGVSNFESALRENVSMAAELPSWTTSLLTAISPMMRITSKGCLSA